jgi:RNA polymerase sigma-70 factor (ECF subfamily)
MGKRQPQVPNATAAASDEPNTLSNASDLMQRSLRAAAVGPPPPRSAPVIESDQQLAWITRAQAGDPLAVEWLVHVHRERVERLLVRVFGARQDLEDLVQNTFLETLRALPNFRRESSVSTFILGIAVRVGRRAGRPSKVARGSQALEHAGELCSLAPSAETRLEHKQALLRVQLTVDRLSEPKRIAFLLWAVQGLSVEDVAEAMQASLSATRSRLYYAQKELKAAAARDPYLKEWLEGGGA